MFSDTLRILDKNTVQYMIELQKEEIEQLKAVNRKQAEANRKQAEASRKQAEESHKQIESLQEEIRRLKADQ